MTLRSRSSPAITSAGSPGSNCCSEKIRIDTKNSVGISCRIRLPRKFSIGQFVSRAQRSVQRLRCRPGIQLEERAPAQHCTADALPCIRDTRASLDRSLELQSDHAQQSVRHLLVALKLGGVRNQELAVIEIDQR